MVITDPGAWLRGPAAIIGEPGTNIVVAPQPWFRDATLDGSTIVPDRWIRLPA